MQQYIFRIEITETEAATLMNEKSPYQDICKLRENMPGTEIIKCCKEQAVKS